MVGGTNARPRTYQTVTNRIVVHEWEGKPLRIRVVPSGNLRSLEISRLDSNRTHGFEPADIEARKLHYAANIALEFDATLSRLVRQGETIRIELKRPRSRPPSRPRNIDEAMILRPSIQELIAPLLFEPPPQPVLRPFQQFGVRWLAERRVGILADDMGLGKTAQALRALEELVGQGTIRSAFVICPKSLLANWEAECNRWVPGLTVVRIVPSINELDKVWSAILGRSHIIITSYEQLRSLPTPLASTRMELVIADEAHRLRRSQAKLVKAFRRLTMERIWALTGTPIERHEIDLATLLSLLEPTRFSSHSATTGFSDLRAQARPYLLRRLKQDVLGELPDVIDTKEIIELTNQQQRAYSLAQSKLLSKDTGDVLQRFTLLRSICDVEPQSGSSSKLDRILEILRGVREAEEKAVVFSYLLQPLDVLASRLAQEYPHLGAVTLTGELTTNERGRVLQKFKSDESIVALLCSSRVGGEGLTLTEANHVIFINEWWNPSANAQARDRVVRLGQERIVHVHRFRCQGTIEEVLDQILNRKSETFSSIVDALASKARLDDSESKELFGEEILGELFKPTPLAC